MSLPDVSRLGVLSDETWREFGLRLAELELPAAVEQVAGIADSLPEGLRPAVRRWHLRRRADPASIALRMLIYDDPVPRDRAEAIFGRLLPGLLESAFLGCAPEGIRSPFRLHLINDRCVFGDDLRSGGAAVMGPGPTTAIVLQASLPGAPVESALDLGCGAGAVAILLAERAHRVVATDVNLRAIALARVNAAINGIDNIEFRAGDLFAPLAGDRFDLLVTQPPWVARPDFQPETLYLHGGPRGDEFPTRVFAEAGDFLAARGRAVILVEWPEFPSRGFEHALGRSLQNRPLEVINWVFSRSDVDAACGRYADEGAWEGSEADFERRFAALREYYDRQGIVALRFVLSTIEPAEDDSGWMCAREVPADAQPYLDCTLISRAFAALRLARGPDAGLLASPLRLPAGARLTGTDDPEIARVACGPEAVLAGASLDGATAHLLAEVHRSPSLADAVAKFAREQQMPEHLAAERVLPAVRELLRQGLLVPGGPGL